jgi:hypothetical protein
MLAVLVMTSLIGLLIAWVVSAVVPSWAVSGLVLLIGSVPMVALGGWLVPLPKMAVSPLYWAAQVMPSRWAFEGLLLLETARQAAAPPAASGEHPSDAELVAALFPAASERMGPRAAALALASMMVGLIALAGFISWNAKSLP